VYKDITGIILSGGKSLRMGINKSLLRIGNKFAIEIIVDLMKLIFENNFLSTNTFEEYEFLKLPMVEDVFKQAGPLGGIHSALLNSKTEKNFIISCDVPLMNREMIKYTINIQTDSKIVISRAAGYLQPLVGIYHRSLLPEIEKILRITSEENTKHSHKSLHKLIESVGTEIIDPTPLPFYSDELFFNLNNKKDYEFILSKIC
jgi:molybdenum cofactor guanylyltransferase